MIEQQNNRTTEQQKKQQQQQTQKNTSNPYVNTRKDKFDEIELI